MARAFGRILSSIWDDDDFLDLDEGQQRLYMFLVSQRNLNHAGLLQMTFKKWARKAKGLTVAQIVERLDQLDDAGFVVLDHDTEEVLVRSLVRRDGVYKQPRVMGAMVADAMEIESPRLRRALLAECERIPLDELSDKPGKDNATPIRTQVEAHIAALRAAYGVMPTPPQSRREVSGEPVTEGVGEGVGEPLEYPLGEPPDEEDWQEDPEGGRQASTHVGASAQPRAYPYPITLEPIPIPFAIPDQDPTSFLSPTASPPGDDEREPDSAAEEVTSKAAKAKKIEQPRPDVNALCARLVELLVANECKPPEITKAWRDAARLLLDADGRVFDKAMRVLEWSQRDHFWQKNIHSMPTFRRQYDKLRMAAVEDWERERAQGAGNVIQMRPNGNHQAWRNPTDMSGYYEAI